jgi:hypothetical protein
MHPGTGRAAEGLKAPPCDSLLLFQMGLHIHARLRAPKNDQIGHPQSMAARLLLMLIWISF